MAKANGLVQEFKKFLSRGSVMDLAVGIIIGTAFTAIVKSLVNDIIMPLIGAIVGGVNFTHLRIIIRKATVVKPELALTYGNFLQNVIDFLIIAFVVFVIVRAFNTFREKLEKLKKQEEVAAALAPTPVPVLEPVVPADIVLLTEIRDLLQKKKSV
jgi:large conductance mechanosensitive channel